MNLGYACLTEGVMNTKYKTCRIKNVNYEKLAKLISHNLCSLENMINYNIENNIKLFRITSDLIPFGSNPVNDMDWEDVFRDRFKIIGDNISKSNMRVSMHPGQYTVLNSNTEDVVERAIMDLEYHTKVLEALGVGQEGKIVLHIGGVYGDKKAAMDRFIKNYKLLNENIKKHLVIENDDKSYSVKEVLKISEITNIPVIFDNLHHKLNKESSQENNSYWINECRNTWNKKDGTQKIHYSQQDPLKKAGSHSKTIESKEFLKFFNELETNDIDIMLEVKDKNISAIKCSNLITEDKDIKKLELEWSRYKYKILENDHKSYLDIRTLLKDKTKYPAIEFYGIIEYALESEGDKGSKTNALMHVWGYFKKQVTEKEKVSFMKKVYDFEKDKININRMKNILFKLAEKYNEKYLLNSYYFWL